MRYERTVTDFALILGSLLASPFWAQTVATPVAGLQLKYFTSPQYPRLARQAMQSGDLTVTVTVDPSGKVVEASVNSPHPLLGDGARETVMQWTFEAGSTARKANIFFHYGFSGTFRECDPVTTVTADLRIPRFIVTVDPLPPFEGDAEPSKPKKKR